MAPRPSELSTVAIRLKVGIAASDALSLQIFLNYMRIK